MMLFLKGAAVTAAIIFCLGFYHARAQGESPQGGAAAGPARAKAVFEQRCAKCHGLDGRGQTALGEKLKAPDFTDGRWQKEVGDARMIESITEGSGDMPPFGRKLSRPDIEALAAHVRGFAKAER